MLFAAQTVDGRRVFREPAIEQFAVGELGLEVGRERCLEGSENPPIAQTAKLMAQGPARNFLCVGTQDGVEPSVRIRVFHLRSTSTRGKMVL